MTHPRTALVIGGGIAGPVAAMALQRAGIQATVDEAHPRSAEGIGIFLTLASNGIDALRTIEADTRALAAGHPTPGILLRSATSKHLVDVQPTDDGVWALFEDGTDATGEVVIGADGIHSAVRRLIDPNAPAPTYVGLVNLGGYARRDGGGRAGQLHPDLRQAGVLRLRPGTRR